MVGIAHAPVKWAVTGRDDDPPTLFTQSKPWLVPAREEAAGCDPGGLLITSAALLHLRGRRARITQRL